MTLDEFLDDYVPRVLKPMGGWMLMPYSDAPYGPPTLVRLEGTAFACPLECVTKDDRLSTGQKAQTLGLSENAISQIMAAADNRPYGIAIRARLLAGLGLSEPA